MTTLTLTIFEGGATLVVEVAGVPGHPTLWVVRTAEGWRTLWPVRGLPALLPERPPTRCGDEPAIGAELTAMVGEMS